MRSAPADALLSPLALSAVVLLVLNDHVFKRHWPGFCTGKLSDVAGLVLLPLVLTAIVELVLQRPSPSRWLVHGSCLAVALGFTLMETWPPASQAFRLGLGVLQWPFRALHAGAWLPIRKVRHWADAEDLLTLPALWLPWRLGLRRASRVAVCGAQQLAAQQLAERASDVPLVSPDDSVRAGEAATPDDDTGRR